MPPAFFPGAWLGLQYQGHAAGVGRDGHAELLALMSTRPPRTADSGYHLGAAHGDSGGPGGLHVGKP